MKTLRLLILFLLLTVTRALSAQTQALLPSGLHDIMCNIVVNAGFNPEEDLAIIDFQTNNSYSYGTKISTSGNYNIYAAYNYPKQTLTFYTRADEFVAPQSCSSLFRDFTTLKNIEHLSKVNTSNVTRMYLMFDGCHNLISLDLSNFDTSKVTNMRCMFEGCRNLTSLDVSNFDTSNVTSMSSMFCGCSSLTSLDLSNFDTSKVTDMNRMFYVCNKLTSLDLSNFDTSNVTNMELMFDQCSTLTSLNLSSFDTSNVTSMSSMFYGCNSLTSLDLSNFDTSNVTDMSSMFCGCSSLTSLDLSNFDTSKVTDMTQMFYSCGSLTSLDFSNFDTSNVRSMSSMFSNCSSLTSLDISNFDTSNVTSMNFMFYGCNSLTSLDVSNVDTSNVTSMDDMFYVCHNLTSLDVSNFDTSNVTSMSSMFGSCSNLTSLDLSNFDTSNVTDMSSMFCHCSSLTSLDISNFDTSNVTSMNFMFYVCHNLTSLDVSNFDTSNVTSMSSMFGGCSNLTSLDLSNFDTSNVTDMSGMFDDCKKLTSIDLSNFDTSKVTDMNDMFKTCLNLNKLTLSFIPLSGHSIPAAPTIYVPADIYDDAVAALPGYNVVKIPAFAPGYYVLTTYRDPVGGALYDNLDNVDGDANKSAAACRDKLKWCISSNVGYQSTKYRNDTFVYDASLNGVEWAMQHGLPFMIWQAVPAEGHKDGYYLRNWATGRYIHYVTNGQTVIESVETPTDADIYTAHPVENDVIENGYGNYWTFTNENLWKHNGVLSAIHAASDYAGVVAWNYNTEGSSWAIRPVTEEELAAIEMVQSVEKALAALENNTENVLSIDGTTPATTAEVNQWVNFDAVDGLVTRAEQITSNATDPVQGTVAGLVDGTVSTFWHSDWHATGAITDSEGNPILQDLEIDLGKVVDEVTLKFASRDHKDTLGSPRVANIYGSNDGRSWTFVDTQDVNWLGSTKVAGMSNPNNQCYAGWITTPLGYRYVKMEVVHTGGLNGDYIDDLGQYSRRIYFNLSELRAYEGQPWQLLTINSIADPALKTATEDLIAQAQEELTNGSVTPETLAALTEATDNLKYAVENRVNTLRDDTDYAGTETKRVNIDYIRNFTSTDWEPLYIPFSMSYDEWANDFEIAAINNVRHDDTNGDGIYDRISIEGRLVKSGNLVPNRPYIIRAKSIGTKTLHAVETLLTPAQQSSINCSTVDTRFVFTGSYENIAASELTEYGCKVLSGGLVAPASALKPSLNPYRWYMTTEEKGSGIKGDMNDDGRISIVDVNILVNILMGNLY